MPFEVPEGSERATRLDAVLEVIYVIFNEGYTATAGPEWTRPDLCHEALAPRPAARAAVARRTRGPRARRAHGAAGIAAPARLGPSGEAVLLADQDRRRWDRLHIHLGLAALARAEELQPDLGPYTLQAAIAACHCRASSVEDTDWQQIVDLYGRLAGPTPSPIIELNRAVAVSMASGPADGLRLVDAIAASGTLDRYHLLHSRPRRPARQSSVTARRRSRAFERAASLAGNDAERALSEDRARASAARGVKLRALQLSDAPAWLAGEDEEQLQWFQMPAAVAGKT